MAHISFLPLGGQDERNKNSYVLKINDDTLVFDCGVKVPINSLYGVNMIAPDYSPLAEDESNNKVKGIFIGYPSFYNHASLILLLQKIGFDTPIYCTEVGKIIIETYLEKKHWGIYKNHTFNFKIVQPLKSFHVGKTEIVPFSICDSIPGSVGWIIKTSDGSIVFIDEFMVSNDRSKIFTSQLSKVDYLTRHNVLALIPCLGNAGKNKSFTTPSHKNTAFYQSVIKKAKGRVLIGCNDSDAYTIINLAKIAKNNNRPFSIYSNTFMNVFSNIVKHKLINIKGLNCVQISEINDRDNAIVVIAATHEQLFKKLMLIADNQIQSIEPKSSDTFILGTQLVPGYEGHAAQLLDKLSKLDIESFVLPKTIMSMSASDEDHKYLLDKLNPKYVFPIQGLYKSVIKFQEDVNQTRVKLEQVHFIDNGEEITIINGELQKRKTHFKLTEKYIGNNGNDDTSASILFERQKLSEAGVVTVTLFVDKASQQFIDKINYETYGIVSKLTSNQEIIQNIMKDFKLQIPNLTVIDHKNNKINHKETKIFFKKLLMKLFEKKFDKRPVVLASIVEVE